MAAVAKRSLPAADMRQMGFEIVVFVQMAAAVATRDSRQRRAVAEGAAAGHRGC